MSRRNGQNVPQEASHRQQIATQHAHRTESTNHRFSATNGANRLRIYHPLANDGDISGDAPFRKWQRRASVIAGRSLSRASSSAESFVRRVRRVPASVFAAPFQSSAALPYRDCGAAILRQTNCAVTPGKLNERTSFTGSLSPGAHFANASPVKEALSSCVSNSRCNYLTHKSLRTSHTPH